MDNKLTISGAKLIRYLLLNLYIGAIVAVMSYAIYFGPRAGEPIAYFMSGLSAGIAFMIFGVELYSYFLMCQRQG